MIIDHDSIIFKHFLMQINSHKLSINEEDHLVRKLFSDRKYKSMPLKNCQERKITQNIYKFQRGQVQTTRKNIKPLVKITPKKQELKIQKFQRNNSDPYLVAEYSSTDTDCSL
ncbi:hypothetical protein HZS_282 [Henneguya salminicola]|nr:hypothetical protein HZS_282 [Henneguya salminicola]